MTTIKTNQDGSLTTNAATLRSIFIAKLLDATPTEISDEHEKVIQSIIKQAINNDDSSEYDSVIISKNDTENMLKAIDEMIENEKELLATNNDTDEESEKKEKPMTEEDVIAQIMEMLYDIQEIKSMLTFAEAELQSCDKGLVIKYDDGTEFQVTIIQNK